MNFKSMTLSEKIKYLREKKNMTQGCLAKESGVSVAEICRIEKIVKKLNYYCKQTIDNIFLLCDNIITSKGRRCTICKLQMLELEK